MPAPQPIAPKRRRRLTTGRATDVINQPLDADGRPMKHFVLVAKNRDELGQAHYEGLGYKVVPITKDGPRLRGLASTAKDAPFQEWMGLILMSIDMDLKQDIDQYGADGQGGIDLFDKIDQMISNPKGMISNDGFARVREDKHVTESNLTKPAEAVFAE